MSTSHVDPKIALALQRSQVRRGARGKAFVGDDGGARAGRAAELAKVRHLRELQRRRERELLHEQPILELVGNLLTSTGQLLQTVLTAPLRLALAFAGRRWRTEG